MLALVLAFGSFSPLQDHSTPPVQSQDAPAQMTAAERAEYERWKAWLDREPGAMPPEFKPGVQSSSPPKYRPTYRLNVLGGLRILNDEWNPVDRQPYLGLELEIGREGNPVTFEMGVSRSEDDEDTTIAGSTHSVDMDVSEVYMGGRWWWIDTGGDARLYTSAGVSAMRVDVDGPLSGTGNIADNDNVLGFYMRLGGVWPIGKNTTFGFDYRQLFAGDAECGGHHFEASTGVISAVFGIQL